MNRKKSSLCYLFLTCLLGGVFVLTSCDKGNDVYNPNHIQEEAKKAFPVKDIDPNQTWEMSSICNASVSVNEKTGGAYTIKVYTENPYNTNGNAFLLAKTSVTDEQTVNFKFDIPAALQHVYVMKVNSKGYSSTMPVVVENGVMKATFEKGSSTSRTVANTRGAADNKNTWNPTVPKIDDSQIFPTQAPSGSLELKKDQWQFTEGANYIVKPGISTISTDVSANFYISGDVSLNQIYIAKASNAKIFILPEATLRIPSFAIDFNTSLSIAKGAKLICTDFNISGSFGTVYNAGSIIASGNYWDSRTKNTEFYNLGSFTFASANLKDTHFYNGGTMEGVSKDNVGNTIDANNSTCLINDTDAKITSAGSFVSSNSNTIVVNKGNLSATEFGVKGSSAFYNEFTGHVVISGESSIDSNNSVWDNEGYFRTGKMTINSTSRNWINRCQLYVDGTMDISTSSGVMIMDAGSYAQCLNMCVDMSRIEMSDKAFINVLNDASLKENIGNNGFYGTGEKDPALFRAKSISAYKDPYYNQTNANNKYSGKIYIATDQHYKISSSQVNPANYTLENGALFTGYNGAEISISSSNCNPGYNESTPDTGGTDKVQNYAYAFEDMTKEVGDYDFNDVVLYVTSPMNGQITATLKAAGATKQLAVHFRNKKTGEDKIVYNDVHAALNVAPGTITNTGSATGKAADVKTFGVGNDFSITEHGDFYIVNKEDKGEIHISEFTTGLKAPFVPYAIRIACANWKWPKERTQITKAYTKFTNWAQDTTSNLDWYSDPESIVNENVIGID